MARSGNLFELSLAHFIQDDWALPTSAAGKMPALQKAYRDHRRRTGDHQVCGFDGAAMG